MICASENDKDHNMYKSLEGNRTLEIMNEQVYENVLVLTSLKMAMLRARNQDKKIKETSQQLNRKRVILVEYYIWSQ